MRVHASARRTLWAVSAVLAGLVVVLLSSGYFFAQSLRLEQKNSLVENDAIARGIAAFIQAREEGYLNNLQAYAGGFRFREAVKRRNRAEAMPHLRQINEFFPEMDGAFLADPAGVLWARYPESPELYGKSFAHRDWYQGVSRQWRPHVSEVYVTAASGSPGLALVVPVRDLDGKVIGIIGSSQRLDVIRQWLLPIQVPNGDLYVVDRKGQFVFHRDRTRAEQLSDYAGVPVVQRLLKGEEGAADLENPVEREVRLSAYRLVPSLGWGVVVQRSKSLVLQRTRTLILVSGTTGLLLTAALAGLGTVAVRNQRRTLAALAERQRAEEGLRQAKQEAERANQAKSEFLSRMSHELRTPLNAILGFGQVLEMDQLGPEQRESVTYILKAGRHLLGLIDEVLDIARIEAGRLSLSLEPVHVKVVLDEARSLIRPLAAERNVRLQVDVPEASDLYVLADRQRLKQVLLNLLSNAVKYSHEGGTITLALEEAPANRLRFKVSDTGLGIPPEKMERLFTPFERLGAESSDIEGTELGLALSKGLMEAMGGTMGVESAVGQGTTFWIELAKAESPEAESPRIAEGAPATAAHGKGATVLYVEDNRSNVRLIERVLARRPGVKLLPAMQGTLALDLAREHRPALILLDLHLPDIDGSEVLQRLQEDPRTQQIPVVVISADASEGRIRRLLTAGARDYLTKPIDIKEFLRVLDETLNERDG